MRIRLKPFLFLLSTLPVFAGADPQHSELWGKSGEKWSEESRLPDFSFAGYQRGEKALPEVEVRSNIRDFGAKGDGKTDDSAAFQRAFDEAPAGAISVPKGRYIITQPLILTRSGVVLRGVDRDQVVLYFPKPLNEIVPNWGATTGGQKTSNYSWSGGFIGIKGSFGSKNLSKITKGAKRGAKTIAVAEADKLTVGQEIEIFQSDLPDNSLMKHLYSGDPGPMDKVNGRAKTSLVVKITAISGDNVTFDRPLRTDLELRWQPQVREFKPTVQESGIENITFSFPNKPYEGHFTELGSNPLFFRGVAHCWAKNLRVLNADSGPFLHGCFNTVQGFLLESERKEDKNGYRGHHAFTLDGSDNLCTDFDLRARFIHDFTVSGSDAGNVFSDGKGVDLSLDHHKLGPYENLFTNIDAGLGTRLWNSGGGRDLGKHCAARGTFWNITAKNPLQYPPAFFGPKSINVVALKTEQTGETEPEGKWFEAIFPEKIAPKNIHRAQLQKRLGR